MKKYFENEEDEVEKEEYKWPEYSKKELWDLNNLLKEKYNNAERWEDIEQWMKDNQVLSKDGSVIITGHRYVKGRGGDYYPSCDWPTGYELLQHKLWKANELIGRKEFAQRKATEELNKVSKDMTVHSDIE